MASWRYRIEDLMVSFFEEFCVRLKVNCNKKLVENGFREIFFQYTKTGSKTFICLKKASAGLAFPRPTAFFRSIGQEKANLLRYDMASP